ncbi:TPA: hypothetical protein DEP58_05455 [Patescibacteria group bacterium]|nr:MAG: Peptidase S14 ClpP [Parcubacteria group bacterium GW2011_GWD2_42_14]HCC05712.1 hypothetical protein [Patescibacteria group bacterium]
MSGTKAQANVDIESTDLSLLLAPSSHILEYLGNVSYETNQLLFNEFKKRMKDAVDQEIVLTVSSSGGPTGIGMNFYDMVRYILRPNLTTVGSGDVDSSGVIIFLSGIRQYVTQNTTMLLHMAGRSFDPDVRYTTAEMEAMYKEDMMKNQQYAEVVAKHSILTTDDVLSLMKKNTVLGPQDIVEIGLAQAIIK